MEIRGLYFRWRNVNQGEIGIIIKMRKYFFATIFAGFIIMLAAGVFAANQIKTTETFIIGTPDVLNPSTATSSELTLYIGDNLSGVTNPVKSAQVAVSGVYTSTADGSITIQLGSDSQIFTMKNVSAPTPFEILYNATGTTDAITSAGTYNYTLTVTPSAQITIYGLSAKLAETHRYRPPTCGTGYAATGNLESSTFDTGVSAGAAYNSIIWTGQLGTGNVGRVKLQLATSDSSGGPWTYYGSDCNSGTYYEPEAGTSIEIGCPAVHNNKRYFRYKTTICSANNCSDSGATTPQVDDVIVNWSP